MWELVDYKTKPTANFVMFGCGCFAIDLVNSKYRWYRYDLVWQKNNKVGFLNANKMPMRNHEQVLVFGRPGFQESATYNPVKTPGGRPFVKKTRVRQGGVYPASSYTSESDGSRHPCTVLAFDHDRYKDEQRGFHPTQKPLALMEWLVKSYTNEGDLVIDPFMGSGTTGVACAKLNRRFLGIEQKTEYFETAVERIKNA
jgi:site-specific DNA-methyltransferase (adenine-specific)